jgi:hypothetical protein
VQELERYVPYDRKKRQLISKKLEEGRQKKEGGEEGG